MGDDHAKRKAKRTRRGRADVVSKNDSTEEKVKQLDSFHTEAQLYRRIGTARAQIAGAVNATMRDTGLPTAIVVELLRGIVAETSLMLERAAGTLLTVIYFGPLHLPLFRAAEEKKQELEEAENV